jgi:molecular chaperone DnaJ
MIDPYQALGVSREASPEKIKQAYRQISRDSHPDQNPGDPEATGRFLDASRAYALLRDPEQRSVYDRTGRWDDEVRRLDDPGVQLAEAMDVFAREFEAASNLPATSDHLGTSEVPVVAVSVTYEEVERGGVRRLPAPCVHCAGSGARDGSAGERCLPCDGSGRAPDAAQIDIRIPRGVADGDPLPSLASDRYQFVARVLEDERWARDGSDLHVIGRIPYDLAVLGGMLELELPVRTYALQVEPGTVSGHHIRIPGEGLPLSERGARGDLVITFQVVVPGQVGVLEQWLLEARRMESASTPVRGLAAYVCLIQARSWAAARGRWSEWRRRGDRASVLRAERGAAALRSASALLTESDAQLRPLLEDGLRRIATEAARARDELHMSRARSGSSALASFVVDAAMVVIIGGAVVLGIRYAAPAMAVAGDAPWWAFMGALHPAIFAVVPLMAGLAAGAITAKVPGGAARMAVGLPLGVVAAAAAAAAGSACYAVAMYAFGGVLSPVTTILSGVLAITMSILPFLLFPLGMALVASVRAIVSHSEHRRHRRAISKYGAATSRLADHLAAFRHLLDQTDDARQPLASLLERAAPALARQAERRRTGPLNAALAMATPVIISGLWFGSTALAVGFLLSVLPAGTAPGLRLATAAAVTALCAMGSLLPPSLLERHRPGGIITAVATAMAALALVGIAGGVGGSGSGFGWLLAGGATAALVLSFRLAESVETTGTAIVMVLSGAVAIILWPVVLILRVVPSGDRSRRERAALPRF